MIIIIIIINRGLVVVFMAVNRQMFVNFNKYYSYC